MQPVAGLGHQRDRDDRRLAAIGPRKLHAEQVVAEIDVLLRALYSHIAPSGISLRPCGPSNLQACSKVSRLSRSRSVSLSLALTAAMRRTPIARRIRS